MGLITSTNYGKVVASTTLWILEMVVDTDILIDHFHGNIQATEFVRKALHKRPTVSDRAL
jgi:hypothetical protein